MSCLPALVLAVLAGRSRWPTGFTRGRPPPASRRGPLEKAGQHRAVKGTLRRSGGEAVEGRFIFDVGVRLPLLLTTRFVERHGLVKATGAGDQEVAAKVSLKRPVKPGRGCLTGAGPARTPRSRHAP